MYLIIGGDSTIGKELSKYWTKLNIPHSSSTRRLAQVNKMRPYVDLATKEWSDLDVVRYDAVVLCAAATKLSECEEHPLETAKINIESTISIANYMSLQGAYLLLLSSNQVFDGSKPFRHVSEQVCPINEYGRQKVETENQILKLPCSAILRLTKVIHNNITLINKYEADLQMGKSIEAYENLYISPISMINVLIKIDELLKYRKQGIYHLSGEFDISYFHYLQEHFKDKPNVQKLIKKVKYLSEDNKNNSSFYSTLKNN
jgi:dTDP-4-dehydrorhamnose reductase